MNNGHPSGTRRMTEHLARSRAFASQYKPGICARGTAIGAVKRARKGLGLSLSDLGMLDALFATSQPQDWTEGRPIVWPSNDELMEMTGLSLASVKRHLRVLIQTGLIYPNDSPTGQRSGRRDAAGSIERAFGFDLSPIAVRYAEIREIGAYDRARKEVRRELEREWTMLRRDISRIVASGTDCGLVGSWSQYHLELTELIESRKARQPLEALIGRMRDLAEAAEGAYKTAHLIEDEQEMNPTGVIFEPPILTTTELNLCKCSHERRDASASQHQYEAAYGGDMPPNEAEAGGNVEQAGNRRTAEISNLLNPGYVAYACPALTAYGNRPRSWNELFDATNRLRPGLGISEHAWSEAVQMLGREGAATALAIIVEKVQSGGVTNPGGYLRGMTGKAREGRLNLERSIHGLAQVQNQH